VNPASRTRREFLLAAGGAVALVSRTARAAEAPPAVARSKAGLASNVWDVHDRAQAAAGQKRDLADPLSFLDRCRELGAAGLQMPLGILTVEAAAGLRRASEERGMYIEGSMALAGPRFDWEAIEKQVASAAAAGAKVVRVVVTAGRRYESFKSAAEFEAVSKLALQTLRLLEPIAVRHRVRVAVENHKDHRVAERLALLKELGSEHIGMCVDLGNSLALCEDPLSVVRAYAPFAFSVHLKDQAVKECLEGFLLGDAVLGEGFLDLPEMVRLIRAARPETRFNLELITRDPLVVPVLTERYWATLPDVPAADLARTLSLVKARGPAGPLPRVSDLPPAQQVQTETRNIEQSLAYARERLGL
jgi:3-oxoisoapionate decarboxylase